MMRITPALLALLLGYPAAAGPADVRVGVFGLFHPGQLTVSAAADVLTLRGDRHNCVLRAGEAARLRLDEGSIRVACHDAVFTARAVSATGPTGQSAVLVLSVPGKISRRFHGRLQVTADDRQLVPVVSMDLETAVASIVAAEQVMSAPPEALKAQAVAARSFIVASGRRHRGFEFCDTTHCQFLREPPRPDHPAALAVRDTTGLVLAFRGTPLTAFYSASCGGRTRTLADAGLPGEASYPYFSVSCAYCARRHKTGAGGHGVGLCQDGAGAMATTQGASFSDILRHYYPGTTIEMRVP